MHKSVRRGARTHPRNFSQPLTPFIIHTHTATAHPAAWDACLAALAPLGLDTSESADALGRAFGWGRSTYWRGSRERAPPDPAAVTAALAVLMGSADEGGLEMEPSDAAGVIASFPECLALDGDGSQARAAVAKLAKEWRMVGAVAAKAVVRTPRVLGYTVDCAGDCIGECDRCWVRF